MSINPFALDILTSLELTVKQGQIIRLLDENGATFGRGETLLEAVLAAFDAHPVEAGQHAAALMLAVAIDEDEEAVLEAVDRINGESMDDDDDDDDGDDDDDDDDDDRATIRIRRE